MSTYLLLRDNKESGPYSFEDLRSKGLKAYDLVWVDGKSAAWRYPSEVEELRSFAPAVEEQPFDRFFKKTAQVNTVAAAQANNPVITAQPHPTPEKEISFSSAINGSLSEPSRLSGEPSSVPGKRIIYVTLPSDKNALGMRVPAQQARVPLLEKESSRTEKEPLRTDSSTRYTKTAEPIEEKFSQVSDGMWKTAVEITPRQNGLEFKRILQPVAAIVCILALLAAGIFIGLSIKSDSFGFSQKTVARPEQATLTAPAQDQPPVVQTPAADPNKDLRAAATPVTPDPGGTGNAEKTAVAATSNTGTVNPVTTSAPALASPATTDVLKKKTNHAKDRSALANQKTILVGSVVKDSTSMSLAAIHREATHRSDENGLDKDALRSNISNMVSVGAGKYSVGTFGGISEVALTVSNHSTYPLDLVVVEVQYVQANKKVFKTENLYFRDVAPGAALMQEAPKSARGIKIQYRVTLINSKELGLSYSGI